MCNFWFYLKEVGDRLTVVLARLAEIVVQQVQPIHVGRFFWLLLNEKRSSSSDKITATLAGHVSFKYMFLCQDMMAMIGWK